MNGSSEFANQRLRSAGRAKDQAKRLAWGFLIGATFFEVLLCVALIDYWLALPANLRMGGFILLLLLLAIGLGGWLKLRRRPTSMKEAALDTEAQRPDLGCVISTAAEYTSGERTVTHEYEPELVAALEEQAAQNLQQAQVSYGKRLLRPASFLAFALVTLLVFAAVAPVAFTALKRTVSPWSKETYTKVEVKPGNMDVPVGSDLDITNLFSGRVPKNPALHWQQEGQTAWQTAALKQSEDGSYVYAFHNLQSALKYQVTGNDAVSELYEITTYVPPEVRSLRIDVAYPQYTGVKPFYQQTPELSVLRASELTLRLAASTKLSKARLRFSSSPGVELVPAENEEWRASFKAMTNAEYWIELADAKGHRGSNEKPYQLKVLPDNPPKIEIIDPARDIRAEATNTIPVKFSAADDFGMSDIKIVYHRLGGPEQILKCAFTNTQDHEVMGGADLLLASLGLKEYELVAYHAEAKDNNTLDGPGIGVSPVYFIEITSEEGAQAKGKPKSEEGQQLNLLVVQKQIIADTTALGANAGTNQFEDLASRQKEATDFAQAYQQSLSTSGAPAEAAKLMDEVVGAMKSASTTLKERKRDAALPPEEKALAGLYQILKLLPKLGNFPTQPPPPTEQEKQEPAVSVALQAIKKQKPEAASNEELADALEEAKQLSHSQADLLPVLDQRGHTPENGAQAAEGSQPGGKPDEKKQNQEAKAEAKPAEKKKGDQAKNDGKEGEGKEGQGKEGNGTATKEDPKQGQEAKASGKEGEGKGEQEGQAAEKQAQGKGEGKNGQQAKAGAKAGKGKGGQQAKADAKQADGKKGEQANQPGTNPGEGKGGEEAKAEPKPGDEKENPGMEKMAELEAELSKQAAALAEKLDKLAGKDMRVGHSAARKAAQAAGQMGAAAQSLRQGNVGAAGTEGGQGLLNMDQVIAALERVLKGQQKLTDVASEDFPKEYEALISEYLRKLSHEQ